LRTEQRRGFPDDYTLFLKQGGKESRRKLGTLSPYYFKIGTASRPTVARFVAGNDWQGVVDDLRRAFRIFLQRAPQRSGKYRRSLKFFLNGTQTTQGKLGRMAKNNEFKDGDIIGMAPDVEYASALEAGFYTKYYKTRRLTGGILAYIATYLIQRSPNSIRLAYQYRGKYNQPIVEFSLPGAFRASVGDVGQQVKRRRRAARRAR
jgi:hypothetical protein